MAKVRVYNFEDPITISAQNIPPFEVKYVVLLELATKTSNTGESLYKATFFRRVGYFKHTINNFDINLIHTYHNYKHTIYNNLDQLPEEVISFLREDLLMENNMLDILASDIWEEDICIGSLTNEKNTTRNDANSN